MLCILLLPSTPSIAYKPMLLFLLILLFYASLEEEVKNKLAYVLLVESFLNKSILFLIKSLPSYFIYEGITSNIPVELSPTGLSSVNIFYD